MSAASSKGDSVAFLLSQLGHRSASVFTDLIASIDLTPPHAGILRAIAAEPGRSQQALSGELGLLPSRVVAYVDELEDRGYVERRRNPDDRRLHALHLTASGKKVIGKIGELGRQHDRLLTAGLDAQQRDTMRQLLATMAEHQGLRPHVHPGYRTLGRATNSR
ncbi:MarR family winged helix-turn-helix transcriptional regulator [Mycobacterium sp.]|uniref:MarR family winged helix-turn-helix transcriptional regulator n=1 Tax=Mycobacterium sp. TaxID=1785 RepID=UPI003342D744